MLFYYNKKLNIYRKHYTYTFFSSILPSIKISKEFSELNIKSLYKSNFFSSCSVIYPIFYKKLSFVLLRSIVSRRYRMKRKLNLNQTIILEGSVSKNKFYLSIPILSFFKNVMF